MIETFLLWTVVTLNLEGRSWYHHMLQNTLRYQRALREPKHVWVENFL